MSKLARISETRVKHATAPLVSKRVKKILRVSAILN